jgi:hypothetical protein
MRFAVVTSAVSIVVVVGVAVGCSASRGLTAALDGGAEAAAGPSQPVAVGTPCTPQEESDPSFGGFNYLDVALESNSPSCGGQPCLVNHFQGLTTCPYGQSADGGPPSGADAGCLLPGTTTPVRPDPPLSSDAVKPWCANRAPRAAVTCSCRCANVNGTTDDDAGPYCTCPSGFACTPLISAIGPVSPTAGSYCIETGIKFDPDAGCAACDPTSNPCP